MSTLPQILAAQQVIRRHIACTPLLPSPLLSRASGAQAYLKLECWQRTGSFKIRGALAKVAALSPYERAGGLVVHHHAGDVAGQQVGSELDALPRAVDRLGDRLGERGLAGAGSIVE